MASIFLIRHGQASAHAEDYDQLSELGYWQCEQLKHYLLEENIQPTKIYYGPRKRHLQSYETLRSSDWPEGQLLPELDEYPAHELLEFGMDQLLALEPDLQEHADRINASKASAGPAYVVLLQRSAKHWMNNTIISKDIESYHHYTERMKSVQKLMKQADKEDCIIMISSAGFISTLLTHLVDGHPSKSLHTAWALYNSCVNVIMVREFVGVAAVNQIHFLPKEKRTFI